MAEVNELKVTLPALEAEAKAAEDELNKILATIPNLPLAEVPDGKDENDNVEHHKFGAKRDYAFKPKEHFELGEALGMMDFETAAKLSGARFVVLKGGLARLERALGQFMLDLHTERARLHRGQSAAAGARRCDVRHGATAEVRRTISLLRRRNGLTQNRLNEIANANLRCERNCDDDSIDERRLADPLQA